MQIKKLFAAFMPAMLLVATLLCGCEQKNADAPLKIEITKGGISSTTISFGYSVSGAVEAAYMITDDAITAEEVLSKGTALDIKKDEAVVSGLTPDTTYTIVAAAKSASGSVALSNMIVMTTKEKETDTPTTPGGNDDFEMPEIPGARIVTVKSTNGGWYESYNYFVRLELTTGEFLDLDFYTLDETMTSALPYGKYTLKDSIDPYVLNIETSGYYPDAAAVEGKNMTPFTEGFVTVDVANGYYSLYIQLTYTYNGTEQIIQAYYNGLLSGATVPDGDSTGKKLIEVLEVGSSSFKFRINAEEGQYWRCSVVDKRTYDQFESNPGAWVLQYGFMLEGTLTFNWENGKDCEYVPGYPMSVTSATDYLIIAVLMDYKEGQEYVMLGGVEMEQIRTKPDAISSAEAEVEITNVGVTTVTLSCNFGSDVFCCWVAMMETANLEDARMNYAQFGYKTFDECLLSLIPGLSPEFKRQFIEPTTNYVWENLKYDTSYTPCVMVVDKNDAKKLIILDAIKTLHP